LTPRVGSRGRLSRSAEFERVYKQGRSTANRHLVLYTFPNPSAERPRLGLSVSRKVGGAVVRNRVKRMLREAFAEVEGELSLGQDVVVVARPSVAEMIDRDGLEGVEAALSELLVKAGLRESGPSPTKLAVAQAQSTGGPAPSEHPPSEQPSPAELTREPQQ
jgi:ribonuclease P protein component